MKILIVFLEILSLLEIFVWYGLVGSYDMERISCREFFTGTAVLGAALYITVKLIKVSAAVTANNNHRKKMVNIAQFNHFHDTTKR